MRPQYTMVSNETFRRIQPLHGSSGPGAGRAALRHQATHRGTPQAVRSQSESSRPETKTKAEGRQALRFLGPRVGILVDRRFLSHLAGDLGPSQTLADDLTNCQGKTVTVIHILPIVLPERLLIDITEQVKRLDADVGSMQAALEQTPEILHRVRVDIPIHVFDRVIDDSVLVIRSQAVIGFQFVAEDGRASFDAFTDDRLKVFSLAAVNMPGNDLPAALD